MMMSRSVVEAAGPGLTGGLVLDAGAEDAGESGADGVPAFFLAGLPECCAISSPSGSALVGADLDGVCWAIKASKGSMAWVG